MFLERAMAKNRRLIIKSMQDKTKLVKIENTVNFDAKYLMQEVKERFDSQKTADSCERKK